jgi:hypothetical protein
MALLTACGGGGGDGGGTAPPPSSGPTDAQRSAAATTAASTHAACVAVQPFYWEIGNGQAALASAAVNSTSDPTVYSASSVMNIASASKWLYGTYVVEKRGAGLDAADIAALNFTSGYTSFSLCLPGQSVQGCVDFLSNGVHTPANDGKFYYSGGHMQQHAAAVMGVGALFNDGLASEIRSQIGNDIALSYSQPQLAGGVVSSGADYARFLRRMLSGGYRLSSQLGSYAVCTSSNPAVCPTGLSGPMPANENMHYSLGHWVEDDPVLGDGAFSSAGAFGFYPWIDASKTWYGLVVRYSGQAGEQDGVASMYCGRAIRKAWVSGLAP